MKKNKGFTLVELLAVIVILGLLVGISIPIYLNVTRHAKENEYSAKKKYIEEAAIRFAEENSILIENSELNTETTEDENDDSTTNFSIVFTSVKLITTGYLSAEKYVAFGDDKEIPYIENPTNKDDNLVCHVITLRADDYNYYAEVSDSDSNCELSSQEVSESKVGIKAYEIKPDGTLDKGMEPALNNYFKWVRNDVVLIVNPEMEFNSITYDVGGKTVEVDKTNMYTDNAEGKRLSDIQNKSNVIVVRGIDGRTSTPEYKFTITATSEDGTTSGKVYSSIVHVRIDRGAPRVDNHQSEMWTNKEMETLVYVNDGDGSGPKSLCYSTVKDRSKAKCVGVDSKVSKYQSKTAKLTGLSNGDVYLWPVDQVGNEPATPYVITIKNVDLNAPVGDAPSWEIDSDISCNNGTQCSNPNNASCTCRKTINGEKVSNHVTYDRERSIILRFSDKESGVRNIRYCFTQDDKCSPTTEVRGNFVSGKMEVSIKWPSNRNSQKICYNGLDNVGNSSETKCSDKYFVDGTAPTINNPKYDNLRTVDFNPKDNESGVYRYEVNATRKGESEYKNAVTTCNKNIGSDSYFDDQRYYDCEFRYLKANKNYDVEINVYNRANAKATKSIKMYTDYKMQQGFDLCNPTDEWCTGDDLKKGVFVKYGNNTFVLYKRSGSNIYGVGPKGTKTSYIDTSCCDHGRCNAPSIKDLGVNGIFGNSSGEYTVNNNLIGAYEALPSNRNKVTDKVSWDIYSISAQDYGKDDHVGGGSELSFDENSLPPAVYNGYTYYFPNRDVSGASCYYRTLADKKANRQGTSIPARSGITVSIGSNFRNNVQYNFYCTKDKTAAEIFEEAKKVFKERYNREFNPNNQGSTTTDPETGQSVVTPSDNDLLNEIKNGISTVSYIERNAIASLVDPGDDVYIPFDVTLTVKTGNDSMGYTKYHTIRSNYGLLSYPEYANLKKYEYFRSINGGDGIDTLLTSYVSGVVYSKDDFSEHWSRVYGHDGVKSTISALFATLDGYYATTPMRYGYHQAALVLPFKSGVTFTDGVGASSDPFVVSTCWGGSGSCAR